MRVSMSPSGSFISISISSPARLHHAGNFSVIAHGAKRDAAHPELAIDPTRPPRNLAAVAHAVRRRVARQLREGQPIGCMVTLRGPRMYEFYDRLINVALPRIRDFRGVPTKSFDGQGNYTLGITEQIIFPEINYDKVEKIRGMDITFVTSAANDEEGQELLKLMNMPFRQRQA